MNAAGSDSDRTTLNVHPLITQNPNPFIDATNGSVIADFSCDAESFPEPTYQWIRLDGSMVRSDVIDTNTPNVLGFNPVIFGDEGRYLCRAFITVDGVIYEANSTMAVLTREYIFTIVIN